MSRHKSLITLVLFTAILLGAPAAFGADAPPFTEATSLASKTGFRGVFVWSATEPVSGVVHYGLSPTTLDKSVSAIPGVADTAQMAVASDLEPGRTYYWQVEDTLSGARTEIRTVEAVNAYTSWNGDVYTIDMLLQLDLDSLPPDIPHDLALQDIADGMNIFAERLYDALDGYARLGRLIVTDTNLDYAVIQPFGDGTGGLVCDGENTTVADVIVQTTIPFDSHTWSGWQISNPCIGFYVGRIGQLVVPWEDELHFAHVASHELMHYAFNSPDLYTVSGPVTVDCKNLDWDGSLMHNTGGFVGKWELTELDRNPTLTPCFHGNEPWSWDVLRTRYTEVPLNPEGPIQDMFNLEAKGHPDGDGLEIWILDREPGASTLTRYTADDTVPPCGPELPQVVDPEGDATRISTGVLIAEPDPGVGSDDNLDIVEGWLRWDDAAENLVFNIRVKDLKEMLAPPAITHSYRWYFDYAGTRYQVRANRSIDGSENRSLRVGSTVLLDELAGLFDVGTDVVTIVVPSIPNAPALQPGETLEAFELYGRRDFSDVSSLTSDVALGSCRYVINQEDFGSNLPPVAADDTASTTEDIPVDVDVLSNDVDPDGDLLTIRSASTDDGEVSVNTDGTIHFTPETNRSGVMTFSYVVHDRKGGTSSATVTVDVAALQDPPAPVEDVAYAPSADPVTIDVLENDVEPDGDPMTIVAVTQGTFGSVTTDGAVVVYQPGGGLATQDAFTYTVGDGLGNTNRATVTVIRTCLGSWSDDLEPLPEDGWTFSSVTSGVEGFPTNLTTWQHTLDPLASSASHSWFSDANDLSANKDDRLISPPVLASTVTRLSFWHRYSFEVDFDGGVLEISMDDGATWQDIEVAGGVFLRGGYTGHSAAHGDRPAWNGVSPGFPLMSQVEVDLGAFADETIKIRWRLRTDQLVGDLGWWVDDVGFRDLAVTDCGPARNRMPDAVDDTAVAAEGTAVEIDVLANDSDPDGDAIFISSVTAPANGTATHDGSSVTYTPNPGFVGTDHFFYSISDGFGGSDTALVTVTVNGTPEAGDDHATTNEDQAVTIDVLANDSDPNGDSLTVSSVSGASNGTASANGDGTVTYMPNPDFNGGDSFSYTVSDPHGATATAVVHITVLAVNDSPVAVDDSATTREQHPVVIHVLNNDFDVDGDVVTIMGVGSAANGAVILHSDGRVRYRPGPHFTGTDSFVYHIEDGNGGVATGTVTVTVTE